MRDPLTYNDLPMWKRRLFHRLLILQKSAFMTLGARRRLLNWMGANIHETAEVSWGLRITNPWTLTMGANSWINASCYFDGQAPITIEAGARVGSNVTILTSKHKVGDESRRCLPHVHDTNIPVTIGRGTWIGTAAIILPGVNVASGCIVGAASLVTRDTQPNGVYVNRADANGVINAGRIKDLDSRESDAVRAPMTLVHSS